MNLKENTAIYRYFMARGFDQEVCWSHRAWWSRLGNMAWFLAPILGWFITEKCTKTHHSHCISMIVLKMFKMSTFHLRIIYVNITFHSVIWEYHIACTILPLQREQKTCFWLNCTWLTNLRGTGKFYDMVKFQKDVQFLDLPYICCWSHPVLILFFRFTRK